MQRWPCCHPGRYSWIQSTEYPPARPKPATFHPAFRPEKYRCAWKSPIHHLGYLGLSENVKHTPNVKVFVCFCYRENGWHNDDHKMNFEVSYFHKKNALLDATFSIKNGEVKYITWSHGRQCRSVLISSIIILYCAILLYYYYIN